MIYHILNGDALREQFPAEIPGERIVFRECLVDGPVKPKPGQELWRLRAEFIHSSYPDASFQDYEKYSYQEILKIKSIPEDSKIYCWFEEDLFCQVNLWFVFNYLKNHPGEVFLILPYPDSPYHFSRLGKEDLIESFEKKAHPISQRERTVLGDLWIHFQDENVFEALHIASQFTERFPFLKAAVEAWRDMIPLGDYPGKPMATLKEIDRELNTEDFGQVFREFQKRLPIYGFGDTQVLSYWKKIKKEGS